MSDKKKTKREPGSWIEIKTKLKEKQVLKIVGYRGEYIHAIDDKGHMLMVKPNSPKVSKIFEVNSDGKVIKSNQRGK